MKNIFLRVFFILFALQSSAQNSNQKIAVNQNVLVQKKLITGFNYGSISQYSHVRTAGVFGLTSSEYKLVNSIAPKYLRENVRCSGTVSNYQNIHEIGNGTVDYTITWWAQLYGSHNNFFRRLEFSKQVFAKNRDWIFKQFPKIVDKSFIYDQVEIYRQTGGKTFSFTFNSHMPFIGWCTLGQSIASLQYVKDNTELVSVELENESYYADYITGFGNSAKVYESNIDNYLYFLEYTVIPEIQKVVGEKFPLGISINNSSTSGKHKYWTQQVLKLYDRLTSKGNNIFLVSHLYVLGYDEKSIRTAFEDEFKTLPKDIPIHISEYNVDASVGTTSQQGAINFVNLFNKIASEYPQITATYYHSMFENRKTVYSFIK